MKASEWAQAKEMKLDYDPKSGKVTWARKRDGLKNPRTPKQMT
ncbi:hypothetical protein COLO4_02887 [Corchorus olitorius]|uniref:Uncharacterized protein n=1 Tax=Corchorus olitorius TaxID=93759 RepID=A0A1R3L085_9ROSI|nr:hypothetical protein COLO4_02887 [Corchorus olitorius]